mmetsp:Transcript_42310/g.126625  ORF Transcript_42310/g.126625 Transcript_42310/m.126625 type:complete len:231 (+) Transcript_42310:638-1330(+)
MKMPRRNRHQERALCLWPWFCMLKAFHDRPNAHWGLAWMSARCGVAASSTKATNLVFLVPSVRADSVAVHVTRPLVASAPRASVDRSSKDTASAPEWKRLIVGPTCGGSVRLTSRDQRTSRRSFPCSPRSSGAGAGSLPSEVCALVTGSTTTRNVGGEDFVENCQEWSLMDHAVPPNTTSCQAETFHLGPMQTPCLRCSGAHWCEMTSSNSERCPATSLHSSSWKSKLTI